MLNVGLLVDSLFQPRWVRRVVETIQASACARVTLVVHNTPDATQKRAGLLARVVNSHHLLYSAYTRLDDLVFRGECQPDAFERVSIVDLVADCPTVHVRPRQTRFSDYIEQPDIERIRAADLDVAIRFGFRILRGEILAVPRYGVWSYHHGDNLQYRGAPAGFWEVMRGDDVTGSILQVLGPDLDNGKVIYRSYAPTDKRSVRRNKNNYYWKSADFVIRKLRDVAQEGSVALNGDPHGQVFTPYSHQLFTVPGNGEMLRLLSAFALRVLREKLETVLYRHQWGFAYSMLEACDVSAPAPFRFVHVAPPRDRFWADPFPMKKGDDHYIFVEELLDGAVHDGRRKAHISAVKVDRRGMMGAPIKVLESTCHLSYPYVFEWRGDDYMVPESAGNRTVELYRCEEFPHRWTPVKRLLENVNAVDPTLLFHHDRWWLFVNMAVDGARNVDELHLFHAADLFGVWTPHKRNPVKSDVRSARPAGRPFVWRGDLYRPAQDCSRRYGYSVVINKVIRLDLEAYEEIEVSRIRPEWRRDVAATHTLNSCEGLTVVDAWFKIPRWRRSPAFNRH